MGLLLRDKTKMPESVPEKIPGVYCNPRCKFKTTGMYYNKQWLKDSKLRPSQLDSVGVSVCQSKPGVTRVILP